MRKGLRALASAYTHLTACLPYNTPALSSSHLLWHFLPLTLHTTLHASFFLPPALPFPPPLRFLLSPSLLSIPTPTAPSSLLCITPPPTHLPLPLASLLLAAPPFLVHTLPCLLLPCMFLPGKAFCSTFLTCLPAAMPLWEKDWDRT